MNSKSNAEIEKALLDTGVPPQVVSHVSKDNLGRSIYVLQVLVFMLVMVAGFAVGGMYLWPKLENITAQNAQRHAEELGALLYDYNFGFSLLIAFFAWIFVTGVIVKLITLIMPHRVRHTEFIYSITEAGRTRASGWFVKRSIERLRGETNPERYIRRMMIREMRLLVTASLALAVISVIAVFRDVQTYSVFTSDAYLRAPFFPWSSTDPREWSTAVSVETGCNHVVHKGDVSNDVIYDVLFSDGASVSIRDAIPVGDSWLDAMEKIDAQLRASKAKFALWDWNQRNPQHPLCIDDLRSRFSPGDYQKVRDLLRLTEE